MRRKITSLSIGNSELDLTELSPKSKYSSSVNYKTTYSTGDLYADFDPAPKTCLYKIFVNLGPETIDYDYPNYSIAIWNNAENKWQTISSGALNKAGHSECLYLRKGDKIRVSCTRYGRTTFNNISMYYN